MATESDNASSEALDGFAEIVQAFEAQVRKGEVPSISEWAETYPNFSEEIQELFPGLLLMEHTSRHLEQNDPSANNPDFIGPYRILQRIGHGGMGVVYLAEDQSLNRLVAVKTLATHRMNQSSSVERFLREAQAAGRLFHPHIVPIYATGEAESVPYYAMQFIRGCALNELLMATRFDPRSSSGGTTASSDMQQIVSQLADEASDSRPQTSTAPQPQHLTWRDATRITREIGSALAHAHAQGILHRDIKPANILIDSNGHAWVADFGLCRLEGEHSMTGTGEAVGTLRYMAPEQLDGESEETSDVYSLGLVLYEMVCGAPAMTETRKAKLIRSITSKDPVKPRRLVPQISKDLETVICKAISKRPVDRYASAGHFVRDLEHLEAGRAIQARRPSALYHLGLLARRQKALTAITICAFILVSVIVAVYTQQLKSKERKRAHGEYSARLNAAEAALQTGATARALQQLALADSDLRGWEWKHLTTRVDHSLQGFDTGAFARDLAFSPDGSQILTCTAEGTFQMRSTNGAYEIVAIHPGNSYACAWHPSKNVGYFLLENGSLKSTSSEPLGPNDSSIRLSPYASTLAITEGGHVLSGSKEGRVDWADLSTGLSLQLTKRASPIVSMERLGDDSVWMCDQSGWQSEWNGTAQLAQLPALSSVPIHSASIHPDGNMITTLPRNGVPLWMSRDELQPMQHLQAPPAHMDRVLFSPDGRWLSGISQSGFVHLWDAQGGQQAQSLSGHHTKVMSLAWHPGGDLLVSGDELGKLRLWHPSIRGGGFLLGHHVYDVLHTSFSQDGRLGMSASRDGTFGVWDLLGGAEHRRIWSLPAGASRAFKLEPDNTAAVMLDTGELQLWDLDRMERTESLPLVDKPSAEYVGMAVHPGRKTIFAVGQRHGPLDSKPPSIEEWSWNPLKFERAYFTRNSELTRLMIDESRQLLLVTTRNGRLEVIDLSTGHTILDVQVDSNGKGVSVPAYCQEKGWALCMNNSDQATIVDATTGKLVRVLKREGDILQSGTFLQGGDRVALGSRKGSIGIWDPTTGDHLMDVESMNGWVSALSASPNGTALLAGTSSGELRYIDCLTAEQRFQQRASYAPDMSARLPSKDQSYEEAGRIAWSQIWNEPDVHLSSASRLSVRMQVNHPRSGFGAALRSSLAFLRGNHQRAIGYANAALSHTNISGDTRSILHGIRGLILLRRGEWSLAARDLQKTRWQDCLRILQQERTLRK